MNFSLGVLVKPFSFGRQGCMIVSYMLPLTRLLGQSNGMVRQYNVSKVSRDCRKCGLQGGGDIGNWEECVGGEDEGTGIILTEMFSCNSKFYPIIISDEKYWSFLLSESFRCGEEVVRLSFWMGHPWGLLQTTSNQIDQLSVSGGYLDRLKNTTTSVACRLIASSLIVAHHSPGLNFFVLWGI